MTADLLSLHRAYVDTCMSAERRVDRAGIGRLPRSQLLIVLYVAHGTTQASGLAKRLGITRQAVAQHLEVMARNGLIERLPDRADRRASVITLTERGDAVVTAAVPEQVAQ